MNQQTDDSRGGVEGAVEEARKSVVESARHAMAPEAQPHGKACFGILIGDIERLVLVERADAARQAIEESADREWRRSMEAYGFDSVAKTLDIMAEKVRQARSEVAERVHRAACYCHGFMDDGTGVCYGECPEGTKRIQHPYIDNGCLAARERIKEGK